MHIKIMCTELFLAVIYIWDLVVTHKNPIFAK